MHIIWNCLSISKCKTKFPSICRHTHNDHDNRDKTIPLDGSNAPFPTPLKLELFVDNLVGQLHRFILRLFPKSIAKVKTSMNLQKVWGGFEIPHSWPFGNYKRWFEPSTYWQNQFHVKLYHLVSWSTKFLNHITFFHVR
jgi:hypothetical protein